MKKLLLILPVIALAACGDGNKKYDAIFTGCERIDTTKEHLVYKCPVDQIWVGRVKAMTPNVEFRTNGNLNLEELYADKEHAYLEVSLNEKNVCSEDYTIRVMTAEPKAGTKWAVMGCK